MRPGGSRQKVPKQGDLGTTELKLVENPDTHSVGNRDLCQLPYLIIFIYLYIYIYIYIFYIYILY